jgi:hypothetical protein
LIAFLTASQPAELEQEQVVVAAGQNLPSRVAIVLYVTAESRDGEKRFASVG